VSSKKGKGIFGAIRLLRQEKSLKLLEELRRAGISVTESFDRDSLKSQLKIADKFGAKFTLILGQKEAIEGTVLMRDMESGKQESLKLDTAVSEIKKRIKQ